jgi:Na+/proline symporter
MSLHPFDVIVVVAYLLLVTFFGVWSGRFIKNMGDYFMPRRFGKPMMIAHAFGTGTASDQAVLVAAETYRSGISGIWWQWVWLPVTPFYWLIAPVMRRLRAVTTADAYELRFDRSVSVLFALVGFIGLSIKIGLMLKGASALIYSSTAGAVDAEIATMVITVLFVGYGMAGGLSAAIMTDFFQGILTVIFSFMLLPFVLNDVGGIEGIRKTINDPVMLEFVTPGEIGWFFIIMYSLQNLMGIVAQPFIMGVCSAGRTEMDGRVGFMVGNIVKRICTIAWSLTALAAIAWYIKHGVDTSELKPDHVYGDIARAFFPSMAPGLLGLFVASLLAAVMNSCDSYMISSSALFTNNLYRRLIPDRGEGHYLKVGRVASLLVVVGGFMFARSVPNVKAALDVWFKIAPMMGIAFWIGLVWRRATPLGAWATAAAGFSTWWAVTRPQVVAWAAELPFAESVSLVWHESGKPDRIYEPWVILLYTTAAVLACVMVSMVTRPTPPEQLDTFYSLTRTPVREGEVVLKPCTMPVGVEVPPRRMLIKLGSFEIPMPSSVSWAGFAAGWIAVAMLVIGYRWIVLS